MFRLTTTESVEITYETTDESAQRARQIRRAFFESSLTGLVFILIFAAFGIWLGGLFFTTSGRLLDVHQNVPILLLSLSALITITPGMFDLSIAGVATLTVFTTIGLTVKQGLPFPLVLVISLAIGVGVGVVNAILVEWLRVNPFIATLGTGGIAAGVGSVYAGGVVISPGAPGEHPLPKWFQHFGQFADRAPSWLVGILLLALVAGLFLAADRLRPNVWPRTRWLTVKAVVVLAVAIPLALVGEIGEWLHSVSWMIVVLAAVAVALWTLMQHTMFGRHLQAIGSNRVAALLAGVPVRREIAKSFVLAGAISALSGICLAATSGSAEPDAAGTYLLPAFASVFLSTVVLSRGRFTIPGTVVSGIFVIWIGIGLVIGGVSSQWIPVINGAILIGAVALSTAMRRKT